MQGTTIGAHALLGAPPIRWNIVIRGVAFGMSVLAAMVVWTYHGTFDGFGADARAFYDLNGARLYIADDHMYLWSPAFAELTAALRLLPFDVFLSLIRGLELAAIIVMAPFGSWLAVLAPPVGAELSSGNINLVLAACVVFGFRWPVLWTLPLMTKPSLGVGLLWFVARRDWRRLAWAIVPAFAISVASFVLAPHHWYDWIAFMMTVSSDPGWPFPVPLWVRLPIAIGLVVWGARTDRPWAAVAGSILAMPRLYFMTPAMLLALLPALGPGLRSAILTQRQPTGPRLVRRASAGPDRRRSSAPSVVS